MSPRGRKVIDKGSDQKSFKNLLLLQPSYRLAMLSMSQLVISDFEGCRLGLRG